MDDFMDAVMNVCAPVLIGVVILGLAAMLCGLGVEGLQSARARGATFDCQRRNLRPVRQLWSTRVACVPRAYGADTLTVRQTAP